MNAHLIVKLHLTRYKLPTYKMSRTKQLPKEPCQMIVGVLLDDVGSRLTMEQSFV